MHKKSTVISNKSLRLIIIVLAWILLILGVVGIIFPVVPTAVFIFISAGLFAKSSPRSYEWLLQNRFIGKYVVKYHQERNLPLFVKFFSIFFFNISIVYTALFLTSNPFLKVLLFVFAISLTIYIFSIRAKRSGEDILQVEES